MSRINYSNYYCSNQDIPKKNNGIRFNSVTPKVDHLRDGRKKVVHFRDNPKAQMLRSGGLNFPGSSRNMGLSQPLSARNIGNWFILILYR